MHQLFIIFTLHTMAPLSAFGPTGRQRHPAGPPSLATVSLFFGMRHVHAGADLCACVCDTCSSSRQASSSLEVCPPANSLRGTQRRHPSYLGSRNFMRSASSTAPAHVKSCVGMAMVRCREPCSCARASCTNLHAYARVYIHACMHAYIHARNGRRDLLPRDLQHRHPTPYPPPPTPYPLNGRLTPEGYRARRLA